MKKIVLLFILIFAFSGCSIFRANPQKKQEQAIARVETTSLLIDKKENKLVETGRAYVLGAKIAINHIPDTNRTVAVDVADRMVSLAQISLGNPSIYDSLTITKIVEDLLLEADVKVLRAETTNKTSEKKINELQAKVDLANKNLANFNDKVVLLEKEKIILHTQYEKDIEKLNKINKENAGKASQWDDENSFWRSLNPFVDLWRFFKKLFSWGLIIGAITILFKFSGIIFPALSFLGNIVDFIFGAISKVIFNLLPQAKKAAGVVSDKVYDSLGHVVASIQESLKKVDNEPIEEDLLKFFADNHQFTKSEVKALLESHSERIVQLIKSTLDKYTNEDSRAVILKIKSDLGIKSVNTKVNV